MPILPGSSAVGGWSGHNGPSACSTPEAVGGRRRFSSALPLREPCAIPATPHSEVEVRHRRQFHGAAGVRRASISLGSDTGSIRRSQSEPSVEQRQEARQAHAAGANSHRLGYVNVHNIDALGRHRKHTSDESQASQEHVVPDVHGGAAHLSRFHMDPARARLGKQRVSHEEGSQRVSAEHRFYYGSDDYIPGRRNPGARMPEEAQHHEFGQVAIACSDPSPSPSQFEVCQSAVSRSAVSQSAVSQSAISQSEAPTASEASKRYPGLVRRRSVPANMQTPISESGASEATPFTSSRSGFSTSKAGRTPAGRTPRSARSGAYSSRPSSAPRPSSAHSSPRPGSATYTPRGRSATPTPHSGMTPGARQRGLPRSGGSEVSLESEASRFSRAGRYAAETPSSAVGMKMMPKPAWGETPGAKSRGKSSSSCASRSTEASQSESGVSQSAGSQSDVSADPHYHELQQKMRQRADMYRGSTRCGKGSVVSTICSC